MATFTDSTENSCTCKQVLVSNIPDGVSEDYLRNYFEVTLDPTEVSKVHRAETNKSKAVVDFQSPVDLRELQKVCKNNPLDGIILNVSIANSQGAIIIHSPPDISEKSFLYYFQNAKRRGYNQGDFKKLKLDKERNILIVYFKSKEVAEKVAQNTHVLEKCEFHAETFDPNFEDDHVCDPNEKLSATTEDISPKANFQDSFDTEDKTQSCSSKDSMPHQDMYKDSTEENLPVSRESNSETRKSLQVTKVAEGLNRIIICIMNFFQNWILDHFEVTVEEEDIATLKLTGTVDKVEKFKLLLDRLVSQENLLEFLKHWENYIHNWEELFASIEYTIDEKYILLERENFTDEEFCVRDVISDAEISLEEFLRELIKKKEISVSDDAGRTLLSSTVWDEFIESEFSEEFCRQAMAFKTKNKDEVVVLGRTEVFDAATSRVNQFFHNQHVTEILPLSATEINFFNSFRSDKLNKLQAGTGTDYVDLIFKEESCIIEGCRAGVKRALNSLMEFSKHFQCSRFIMSYPRLNEFTQTSNWKNILDMVTSASECIITDLPDCRVKDADLEIESCGPWLSAVVQSFQLTPAATCHLVDGEVQSMKVDAIVICRYQKGIPNLASDREITCHGAKLKEYRNNCNQQTDSNLSHPFVRQSGSLPCKVVIEIDVPELIINESDSPKFSTQKDILEIIVKEILQEAEMYHFSSLAFPVIWVDTGADDQDLPIYLATEVIFHTIYQHILSKNSDSHYEYGNNHGKLNSYSDKKTSLTDISLCSTRAACLKGFEYAIRNLERVQSVNAWKLVAVHPYNEGSNNKTLTDKAIQIIKGDIGLVQADVTIMHLDCDLDLHKRKITRSLLAQVGPGLLSSLFPQEAKEEELAETRFLEVHAGRFISPKKIYFLNLPPWGPEANQILTRLLSKSLDIASASGYKTIALPALGVGELDYPVEFVAKTTIGVVANYLEKKPPSLESVKFVIYHTDRESLQKFNHEHALWIAQRVSHLPPSQATHHSLYSQGQTSHVKNRDHRRGGCGSGQRGGYSLSPNTELVHGNPYDTNKPCKQIKKKFDLVLRSLTVLYDSITEVQCDIIVNSTNSKLDLSVGSLSKSLRDVCGKELIEECKIKKKVKQMSKKGIVVTSAPRLNCKRILHVDLEKFKKNPKKTLEDCMDVAMGIDKFKSMAFPVLGSGKKSDSSKEMVETLTKVLSQYKNAKPMKDVLLVVHNPQLCLQLITTVENLLPSLQLQQPGKEHSKKKKGGNKDAISKDPSSQMQNKPHQENCLSHPQKHPPATPETCMDTISVFIFSDHEDARQNAKDMITAKLSSILSLRTLSPSHTHPPPQSSQPNSSRSSVNGKKLNWNTKVETVKETTL